MSSPCPHPDRSARAVVLAESLVYRALLRGALDGRHARVVGSAAPGPEALELALREQPEVIVLDATLLGPLADEPIRSLRRLCPDARLLVIVERAQPGEIERGLQEGVAGFLSMDAGPREVGLAVDAVLHGWPYVSTDLGSAVSARLSRS